MMNTRFQNTQLETVMLSTLVSLLPTRFKWLRRVRYALLLALMMRAWMQHNQTEVTPALASETGSTKSTTKRKRSKTNDA